MLIGNAGRAKEEQHKNKLYNPENPFRYAQTLMLAQDFPGAMKLLWEKDCAVEAVHAALSLRFHGVGFAAPGNGVGDDRLWDWVHRYARQFQNTGAWRQRVQGVVGVQKVRFGVKPPPKTIQVLFVT